LCSKSGEETFITTGKPIALAADRDRVYLFDAESGARVRA